MTSRLARRLFGNTPRPTIYLIPVNGDAVGRYTFTPDDDDDLTLNDHTASYIFNLFKMIYHIPRNMLISNDWVLWQQGGAFEWEFSVPDSDVPDMVDPEV